MSQAKFDNSGNMIGTADFHVKYHVEDMSNYSDVAVQVEKSLSTETVYVKYFRELNGEVKSITCRFSNHENNAVKFGDQLDGYSAKRMEILFALGYATRTFTPETFLSICNQPVKKTLVANYEEAELTIREMYALGEGADISAYTGKIAKGSNYLILGDCVTKHIRTGINSLGQVFQVGEFTYELV